MPPQPQPTSSSRCRAAGRACGRPGRTSRLRLLERRVRGRVARRRCRSSTGRAPARRTGWRRRSGGGSPRRRAPGECRRPSTTRRQRGRCSCGGGGGGLRWPGRASARSRSASAGDGRRKRIGPSAAASAVVRVAGVHALDLEVAGHVGARHAEVAGRGEQVGQAALVLQVQADRGVRGAGAAAVVRREPERDRPSSSRLDRLGDRELRAGRVVLVWSSSSSPPSRTGRSAGRRGRSAA